MAARTFNEETHARMLALHAEGFSLRHIAEQLGWAPSTVSKHAKAAGILFNRSQTAAATHAHKVDLAAESIALAEEMVAAAKELLRDRHKPFLVFNFGGKDNTYAEHELAKAPIEAVRNAVVTAGIAFDKARRIVERTNPELASAEGLVDRFAAALEAGAEALRGQVSDADPA